MTTLFVVRHGQTTLNAQGRFRGRADPSLDSTGREQAQQAARQLASAQPEAVHTSPLRRAVETAQIIAGEVGLEVSTLTDLIDIDCGSWEGLTPEQAAASHPEAYQTFRSDPLNATLPGGEAVKAVQTRALDAIRALADAHPSGTIVTVTHEMPIRLILAAILGRSGDEIWNFNVPTGSINRIETSDHGYRLTRYPGASGSRLI